MTATALDTLLSANSSAESPSARSFAVVEWRPMSPAALIDRLLVVAEPWAKMLVDGAKT